MDRFAFRRLGRPTLLLSAALAVSGCGAGATLADDESRPLVTDRLDTLGRNLNALVVPSPTARSPLGELAPPSSATPFPDPPDPPSGN